MLPLRSVDDKWVYVYGALVEWKLHGKGEVLVYLIMV